MHEITLTDPYLAADLIGFTTGLAIAVLLLVLALRARRLPGARVANVLLALVAIVWNVGGLAHALVGAASQTPMMTPLLITAAIQFSAAAVWPIPMLAMWKPYAVSAGQRLGLRVMQIVAPLVAAALVTLLWCGALLGTARISSTLLKELTGINACIMALAAFMFLRVGGVSPLTSPGIWFSEVTVLVGVVGTAIAITLKEVLHVSPEVGLTLAAVGKHAPLLIVLGAFFLFARFRFADLFIRHSLRLVLASMSAITVVIASRADLVSKLAMLTASANPKAGYFFIDSVLVTVLLMVFLFLNRHLGAFVDRWIVRVPDYRSAQRLLGEQLRRARGEAEVIAVTQHVVRHTLQLDAVVAMPLTRLPPGLWPIEIHDGEIVELDTADPLRQMLALTDHEQAAPKDSSVELLVPVRTAGVVTSLLVIAPGEARRGLVTQELQFLRGVAIQMGGRLDALQLEREAAERQHRETLLRQQLTEAELRALRAQVNPHFLFNSLNTIADLIVTNPTGAEAMTLRLARVFRHVLAHSSRPLTPIGDEIDFLRAYLQIEEARFSGRLHVHIDVSGDVALQAIPSLILQPLVENALKHGLAPKPGPGHLWISARAAGDDVCVWIDDDGEGLSEVVANRFSGRRSAVTDMTLETAASLGVGLTNIEHRLAMVYDGRASLSLQPRDGGGTRATIVIPRTPLPAALAPRKPDAYARA